MVFCSNLNVKALLSRMLITVLEIGFEYMCGVCVCVLCLVYCFGLGFLNICLTQL